MNDSPDKGYTIYCSRCGAEMNSNSRYCMKCGNLNYDHSANANMKNYIKNDNSSYQVGSGRLLVGNDSNSNDEYYFYYPSIEDYVYVPFAYLREDLSGYVKIIVNDGGEDIYISVSDGKYGFPLTNINDIDTEKVKEYSTNYSISDFSNYCHLK